MRPEFIDRKLQLIAEDLGRLADFHDLTYDDFLADEVRLAAIERMLERIVLRAIDVNEHLISALATGEEQRSTRLTYRETFLALGRLNVLPEDFSQRIARSAGRRNVLVHEYNDVDPLPAMAMRSHQAAAETSTYSTRVEGGGTSLPSSRNPRM